MTEIQQEFVDWATNPERVGTKRQWAKDHGITEQTLYKWQRAAWYRDAHEARMRDLSFGPEAVAAVVAAVQKEAAKGDAPSARLYLAYLEKIQPMKPMAVGGDLAELSTDQLLDMLEGPIA